MTDLFDRHEQTLRDALDACSNRHAWTPYIESPSRALHPDGAKEAGRARFHGMLGRSFDLEGRWSHTRVGEEVSPYTREPLGIDYPRVDHVDALYDALDAARSAWVDVRVERRVGVCLEILDRLHRDAFANAYATMHTAGQAFMMAFAGSGANSLDRGLEAVAYAYRAMKDVPTQADFSRSFGKTPVRLQKSYRLRPRGTALVVTCASYPAWNAYPAIFASLATGNTVVVKPHPGGTLPMAMAVQIAREVLAQEGFDPNLIVLAPDSSDEPVTALLARDPRTSIVDFTGNPDFGDWLETHCPRSTRVYTETAGCNAVVVESTPDLDAMVATLAQGITLFSGQMCTTPQNVFVPASGVRTDTGLVSSEEFAERLVVAIDELVAEPRTAAAVCGALQNDDVLKTMGYLSQGGGVLRESRPYQHPEFPGARTATPLVIRETNERRGTREWFGPVAFVNVVDDLDTALRIAVEDIRRSGAISSYVYSMDDDVIEKAEDAFWRAGASVAFNLVGHRPMNFTAGYSDYHVTGLNPAGTACLTDLAFVADRFRIVQSKRETMG